MPREPRQTFREAMTSREEKMRRYGMPQALSMMTRKELQAYASMRTTFTPEKKGG